MKGIIFTTELVPKILDGTKTQTRRVIHPQPELCNYNDGTIGYVWEYRKGEFLHHWEDGGLWLKHCPYGQVGDELYLKETYVLESDAEYGYTQSQLEDWAKDRPVKTVDDGDGEYHLIPHYRATEPEPMMVGCEEDLEDFTRTKWRSPLFMPEWASRCKLVLTGVGIERVQDISEEDAIAEGVEAEVYYPPEYLNIGSYAKTRFRTLWNSINAKWKRRKINGEWHHFAYPWDELACPVIPRGADARLYHCIPNPWVFKLEFERV